MSNKKPSNNATTFTKPETLDSPISVRMTIGQRGSVKTEAKRANANEVDVIRYALDAYFKLPINERITNHATRNPR